MIMNMQSRRTSGDDLTPEKRDDPLDFEKIILANSNIAPEAAARLIEAAEQFIKSPQEDLAYAEGKMDTERLARWVGEAAALLARAGDELTGGRTNRAVGLVEAARALAGTADMLMAQTLGAESLPSRRGLPALSLGRVFDREQVSHTLLRTHRTIADYTPFVTPEAAYYLKQAESAYSTACGAYLDGNYRAASDSCWLAQGLLRVIEHLARAAGSVELPDLDLAALYS